MGPIILADLVDLTDIVCSVVTVLPDPSPNIENTLLLQLAQDNEGAFEQLYSLYSPRLYGHLLKMVKSESIAEELLQEVFFRLWDKRKTIGVQQSFRAYLFRITENLVFDFYRKAARDKKLHATLAAAALEHYLHIEESLFTKANQHYLQKAIDTLPPQRRQVFTLCKLEGQSYEEVSKTLGISTSTISDHIVKATRALREFYKQNPELVLGMVFFPLTNL